MAHDPASHKAHHVVMALGMHSRYSCWLTVMRVDTARKRPPSWTTSLMSYPYTMKSSNDGCSCKGGKRGFSMSATLHTSAHREFLLIVHDCEASQSMLTRVGPGIAGVDTQASWDHGRSDELAEELGGGGGIGGEALAPPGP